MESREGEFKGGEEAGDGSGKVEFGGGRKWNWRLSLAREARR